MLGEYDTEHNFKPTVDDHLHLRLHTLPPQVSSSTICSVFERPSVCGAHHGYPPPNTVIFTWAKPHKSWLMDARLCRPDILRPLHPGRGFRTDSQDHPSCMRSDLKNTLLKNSLQVTSLQITFKNSTQEKDFEPFPRTIPPLLHEIPLLS